MRLARGKHDAGAASSRPGSLRVDVAEAGAAVADLGTILPIAAALVLVNGVDPATTLLVLGAVFVATGIAYRVPVPVQPIKAAAAIAIATGAPPGVIAGAALILGAVLTVLGLARAGPLLARVFPKPVIRGNQLGVGLMLVTGAFGLVNAGSGGSGAAPLLVAAAIVAVLTVAAGRWRAPVAVAVVVAGVAWSLAADAAMPALSAAPSLPSLSLPTPGQLGLALTLLVIPQLPLTLGNAVVGTAELGSEYFGARAQRVSTTRLLLSSGAANLCAGALGGMPMCHGSSGLTAYHRLGARGGGSSLVAGGLFVTLGLVFGPSAPQLFALVPLSVLGGLLAYAGMRHALLVTDQRGAALLVALLMGGVGAVTRNLSYGMAVGLPAWGLVAMAHSDHLHGRRRPVPPAPALSQPGLG